MASQTLAQIVGTGTEVDYSDLPGHPAYLYAIQDGGDRWILLEDIMGDSAGGSDTQVQFNDAGSLGGDTALTWNKTTNILALGVATSIKGVLTLAGNTSGVVTIQPAAAAGTWSMTLPTNDGDSGQFLQTNGSGVTTWAAGGGAPGGSDTQIQYNNASAFGANSAFTVDTTNKVLNIIGSGRTGGLNIFGNDFGQNQGFDLGSVGLYYHRTGASVLGFGTDGTNSLLINYTFGTGAIGWGVGATGDNAPDLLILRDAAGVLAQRNGANAQTLRVYNTYTDASNYERLSVTGNSIVVETAGTGTDNIDLTLTPAGTGVLKFGAHSALAAETVSGYITIKDSGGTARKIAVVT